MVALGGDSEATECLALDAILDRATELVRPLMDHHHTGFEVVRATELESITFPQAELITSAVLNLLLNAIQAAGERGLIGLHTCIEKHLRCELRFAITVPVRLRM